MTRNSENGSDKHRGNMSRYWHKQWLPNKFLIAQEIKLIIDTGLHPVYKIDNNTQQSEEPSYRMGEILVSHSENWYTQYKKK